MSRWNLVCLSVGLVLIVLGFGIILWHLFLLIPLVSRWLFGAGILVILIGRIRGVV